MKDLTPQQIVRELDRFIVGQNEAKRVVAIALRNRFRRLSLPAEMQAEITPKNILMMGPTGVGKTEIARRLAKIADAPFLKVEATKFTQVGYVGRDVESIIRDLMDVSVGMVHDERVTAVREQAAQRAEERIVEILMNKDLDEQRPQRRTRGASAASPSNNGASGALPAGISASSSASSSSSAPSASSAKGASASAPRRRQQTQQVRKAVKERLDRHELEEQIIEIELEPEENYSSVFEFVSGVSGDELGDSFQELLNSMPSGRRRSRNVPVKEAHRTTCRRRAGG